MDINGILYEFFVDNFWYFMLFFDVAFVVLLGKFLGIFRGS